MKDPDEDGSPAAPPIIFSMGDPNGIGPEVVLKALQSLPVPEQPHLLFGDPDYFEGLSQELGIPLRSGQLKFVPVGSCPYPPRWGKTDQAAGALALESLRRAVHHCSENSLPLLVTPPVNKAALHLGGCSAAGQTEIVGSFYPDHKPVMTFFSDRLKMVLLTVHVPLREVPALLEEKELIRRTELFIEALQRIGLAHPRLALCGLNPHASEGGLFGEEEATILEPAAAILNQRHGAQTISGPYPADTVFRRALAGEFDGVIALYHDQGLIPMKLVAFDSAVNVSLGLPLLRTSPDHGTAFEIAGQGKADAGSMLAAIRWGIRLRPQPETAAIKDA